MKYTNNYDLNLSMAVWLATDDYDHSEVPNEISVTTLLRSPRQIILGKRMVESKIPIEIDISTRVASRMGTAIHDSLETSWRKNYKQAMKDLGYSQDIINRIIINPEPATVTPDMLPVYLENRVKKPIGNHVLSGKYDFIGNGRLEDYKSTGVYSYIKGTNTEKFKKQGSMYKWLNPDIITDDEMTIQYVFFNWEEYKATQPNYPSFKIIAVPIKLLSLDEIETWMSEKLNLLDSLQNIPEPELPLCNAEDLWQSQSSFAYYHNPDKRARASKTFDDYYAAHNHLIQKGSCGVIVERPGQVRHCAFCGANSICTQKDTYIANGSLVL